MRRIQFQVEDQLPPKKGGATSMWGKPLEATRLIALRKNALEARGSQPIFTVGIRLTLRVHVGFEFAKQFGDPGNFGDLDTFVSGVCDGLMKAHPTPGDED